MSAIHTNNEFQQLTGTIRRILPTGYLAGILGSYAINAFLITLFLAPILGKVLPGTANWWLAVPGAFVVQYFRALIIFTDQLFPGKEQTSKYLVQLVALGMTVWGLVEAFHLVSAMPELTSSEFWSVYGFAASIIVAGYILEISFVKKTNELTYGTNAPTLPAVQQASAKKRGPLPTTDDEYSPIRVGKHNGEHVLDLTMDQ